MTPRAFGGVDWGIIAAYAAVVLGIGFHYSRRQRTTDQYFVGDRRTRPIIAGISLFSATTSVISYIGGPGEYVQYGPAVTFLVPLVTLPFFYLSVGWILIPLIMKLPITSAYELLEVRLGRRVRQLGSLVYIVPRLVWMALILHIGSTILVDVIGCDRRWTIGIAVLTGAVTTTYTLFGGFRTVMITEVVQSCLLLSGAVLTILSISWRLGGAAAWWPHHWEKHWAPQPFFSLDPHVRVTVIGAFMYLLLGNFCVTGTDQVAVQRFLTTRDTTSARRAFLLSIIATAIVTVVLGLVGAALLGFFRSHPEAIPAGFSLAGNGDAFFPLYIAHYLPPGISGLLVSCLLASAMSVLAASINATVTAASKDFVEVSAQARRSDADSLRQSRWLTLAVGSAVILASIGMGYVRGDFVEVATKTVNLFTAPLFGFFFFAMFVGFATPFGAVLGALYGTAAAVVIAYWDALTGGAPLSFLLIIPLSLVATIVSGSLFSLAPTRGRSFLGLGAWSAAALLPLLAFVVWIAQHRR